MKENNSEESVLPQSMLIPPEAKSELHEGKSVLRRREFYVENREEVTDFLNSMSFGFLGIPGDEYPEVTPLNFVWLNDIIYFHGSRVGSKMTHLRENSKVTFAVAKEFAIIPSYFVDPEFACPATAFFKSVNIRGNALLVEDLEEKMQVLSALMLKLQPEGGYKPFSLEDPEYLKQIRGVAVVKIEPVAITGKFKFGQNQKKEKWDAIGSQLSSRGLPMDEQTRQMMEKYCPAHKK